MGKFCRQRAKQLLLPWLVGIALVLLLPLRPDLLVVFSHQVIQRSAVAGGTAEA